MFGFVTSTVLREYGSEFEASRMSRGNCVLFCQNKKSKKFKLLGIKIRSRRSLNYLGSLPRVAILFFPICKKHKKTRTE